MITSPSAADWHGMVINVGKNINFFSNSVTYLIDIRIELCDKTPINRSWVWRVAETSIISCKVNTCFLAYRKSHIKRYRPPYRNYLICQPIGEILNCNIYVHVFEDTKIVEVTINIVWNCVNKHWAGRHSIWRLPNRKYCIFQLFDDIERLTVATKTSSVACSLKLSS